MKVAVALVGLSVVIMVGMIYQAVHQEIKMRNAKVRLTENSIEVKKKEEAIVDVKAKIETLKTSLETVNSKIEELKKKKEEASKTITETGQSLETCNKEKARQTRAHFTFSGSLLTQYYNARIINKHAHELQH